MLRFTIKRKHREVARINSREEIVRRWFGMWLAADCGGIGELFDPGAVYVESWGPEYRGLDKIRHWFEEWNTRGRVCRWDIKRFFHSGEHTAVEWYFKNEMNDGTVEAFDGMSLIRWSDSGKIRFLQEFGCSTKRYDPYAGGAAPQFDGEPARWF